jgi:L-lactate dehydrogenase complex protein LldE
MKQPANEGAAADGAAARPADVYLFATCLIDLFDPDAGVSTVELLESLGMRVHFPEDQTCCGQPAYTSGFPDEARAVARRQLGLFPEPWPVIVPSGSCAGMMRHHYPALFAGHPEEAAARELATRVFELTGFLVDVGAPAALGYRSELATKVVLHTSCSARREMGAHLSSRALLAAAPGVTLVEQQRESECCGFGGTFSVRHPEISGAIANEKVDALLATGADALVSADCGCLLNLNGTLEKRGERLRGQHIATFLRQRQRGPHGR